MDYSVDLIQELDSISKIHYLKRDDIDEMMIEFATRLTVTLRIERMSVWLFDKDGNLNSIGEYDARSRDFSKDHHLLKSDFPNYFKAISENKIILVRDVLTDPKTMELNEGYSIPAGVKSLMDIPLRIAGSLVGVMCFEKTTEYRDFSARDQAFAFSVSLVFASNLEARQRRALQSQLEQTLYEKERLIKELNHRVKNNFSILIGLLRIAKQNTKNNALESFIDEHEQQIFSILKIHELLSRSEKLTHINISDYLTELSDQYRKSHSSIRHQFSSEIEQIDFDIPTKQATHIGLIVSEVIINSIKHALPGSEDYRFIVRLSLEESQIKLVIGDNGRGFDFQKKLLGDSLGLPLIKDLIEDADLAAVFPTMNHSYYVLRIPAGDNTED